MIPLSEPAAGRIWRACTAVIAALVAAQLAGATEPFGIVYGRAGQPDGPRLIVETGGGDLLVADTVADCPGDEGRRGCPQLARVTREGRVAWSRDYPALAGSRIIAAFERRGRIHLLLAGPSSIEAPPGEPVPRRIDLLLADGTGTPRRRRLVIEPVSFDAATALAGAQRSGFVLAARHRLSRRAAAAEEGGPLALFRVGLDGRSRPVPISPARNGKTLRLAPTATRGLGLLATAGEGGTETALLFLDGAGRISAAIEESGGSYAIEQFVSQTDGIWTLGRGADELDADCGRTLRRYRGAAAIDWERRHRGQACMTAMVATPDGGVLLGGVEEGAVALLRLDPEGRLLWHRRLPTADHAPALRVLDDGWLAVAADVDAGAALWVAAPGGEDFETAVADAP